MYLILCCSVWLICVDIDMPSYSEVNRMRDQLFGGIDEDDGLDKAFEAIQSMRGRVQYKNKPKYFV